MPGTAGVGSANSTEPKFRPPGRKNCRWIKNSLNDAIREAVMVSEFLESGDVQAARNCLQEVVVEAEQCLKALDDLRL